MRIGWVLREVYYVAFLSLQPPNDSMSVSRESLVLALRQCLSATDKFAKVYCMR